MQLLICKLKTNGSKQIIIKAYTVQGKAFYLKCGFKCMDWGDLHYDLLPEVDMPDYANLSELITSATSCVLGPVRTRSFADMFMRITRPRSSTNPKTMTATKRRAERKLVEAAKLGGNRSDYLINQVLPLSEQGADAARQMISNAAEMIKQAGKHNRLLIIKSISNGLPSIFVRKTPKVMAACLKRARENRTDQRPTVDRAGIISSKSNFCLD